MSLSGMVAVWNLEGLTPTEKLVALCIADFGDQENKCWPSQALISKRCGISRETVNRTIKRLSDKGVVKIQHRIDGKGQLSNVYFLAVSCGVTEDHRGCDERSHRGVTEDHRGCDVGSHRGVTEDHTEPTNEPTNEEYTPPLVPPEGEKPKRKTQFPKNFELTPKHVATAQRHGVRDPTAAWEHFRAHHEAKGSTMANWDRAWVTWCINDRKFGNGTRQCGDPVAGAARLLGLTGETMADQFGEVRPPSHDRRADCFDSQRLRLVAGGDDESADV